MWQVFTGFRPGISPAERAFASARIGMLVLSIVLPFIIYVNDLHRVREAWYVPCAALNAGTLRCSASSPHPFLRPALPSPAASFSFLCCSWAGCTSARPWRLAPPRRPSAWACLLRYAHVCAFSDAQASWLIRDRSVFMKDVLVVGTSIGVTVVLLVQFCAPDVSDEAVEGILLVFLVLLFISTVHGLVRGSLASQVPLWVFSHGRRT